LIQDETNKQFEENSEAFTLEAIIDLRFEENAGLINEVSEAASKEYEIEKVTRLVRWYRKHAFIFKEKAKILSIPKRA
jgi:hypothetical protein